MIILAWNQCGTTSEYPADKYLLKGINETTISETKKYCVGVQKGHSYHIRNWPSGPGCSPC